MGCDYNLWRNLYIINIFLLTHPVWDVTELISPCAMFWIFLLTHPVWDVTSKLRSPLPKLPPFLLTHPVWDVTQLTGLPVSLPTFLLTHPVWDVTRYISLFLHISAISTHTSRVGCDDAR